MHTRIFWFVCLLVISGLSNASGTELFRFWPGPGAKAAPGFQGLSEHPCGEVANALVSKLPTAKEGPLLSDVVVELNLHGRVIRRWPIPVDYTPHALRGEELLVVLADKGFWVRSNGAFRKATTIAEPDEMLLIKCDLTDVFGKSGFAQCGKFLDMASHKKRTLGYEGVCS
ncbi:MAG: hypothetical protein ABL973_18665 [Micropepsaceae bacterium]